jgi:hypothetical protein
VGSLASPMRQSTYVSLSGTSVSLGIKGEAFEFLLAQMVYGPPGRHLAFISELSVAKSTSDLVWHKLRLRFLGRSWVYTERGAHYQ